MLKIIAQLSAFLVGTLAQSQVSETREMSGFSKIVCKDKVELVLAQAESQNVKVEAQDALSLSDIVTEVKDNTLYVRTKDALDERVKVYILMPELTSLDISGGGLASVAKELNVAQFEVTLSSRSIFSGNVNASKLTINAKAGSLFNGNVTVGELEVNLRSKATARLAGWAPKTNIVAQTGSNCEARRLFASQLTLDASGNSSIAANAEKKVKADISEGSRISWSGQPETVQLPEDAKMTKSNTIALSGI